MPLFTYSVQGDLQPVNDAARDALAAAGERSIAIAQTNERERVLREDLAEEVGRLRDALEAEWEDAIERLPASASGLASFVDGLAENPLGPVLIAIANAGEWSQLASAVDETARPMFTLARLANARATEFLDGRKPSIEASGYAEGAGRRAMLALDDIVALSSMSSPDVQRVVSMIDGNDRRFVAIILSVREKLARVRKGSRV